MKILVTGANGQLGREVARQGIEHELVLTDYDTLDITDSKAVSDFIREIKVDAAIQSVEATIQKMNYTKLDFKLILEEDVTMAIAGYIKETKADLLTTFTHKLSLEEKIFGRSVTRKVAYQAITPLLAIKRK